MHSEEYILSLLRRGIRNRREKICFESRNKLYREKLDGLLAAANEGNTYEIQKCRTEVYSYGGEYQYTLYVQYLDSKIPDPEKDTVIPERHLCPYEDENGAASRKRMFYEQDDIVQELMKKIYSNIRDGNKEFEIYPPYDVKIEGAIERLGALGPNFSHVVPSIETEVIHTLFGSRTVCRPQYTLGTYLVRHLFFESRRYAQEIASEIFREGMDAREMTRVAHDYLHATVRYDVKMPESKLEYSYAHSAYGALVNRCSVCQGIADAYMMLLRLGGVNCQLIHGYGATKRDSEGHTWNLVQLEDGWYHVDVTWDIGAGDAQKYKYFLRDSSYMRADHIWNMDMYKKYV